MLPVSACRIGCSNHLHDSAMSLYDIRLLLRWERMTMSHAISSNSSMHPSIILFPSNVLADSMIDLEVQKAKEETVLTIDRSSPEDKINAFRDQGEGLELVMNRQRRLGTLLGPLHGLVGGKTLIRSWIATFLPSQRVLFVVITVFFNIYFVYVESTKPAYEFPVADDENRRRFTKGLEEYFIIVLQIIHMSLAGLLFIRNVLNSRAADSIKPPLVTAITDNHNRKINGGNKSEDEDEANNDNEKSKLASRPFLLSNIVTLIPILLVDDVLILLMIIFSLLWDSIWLIVMFVSSYLGYSYSVWFYALCLLDLIYLFDLLKFLVIAMQRNIIRIGFTIIMSVILLYFYAILNYLFIQDQYSLNNHSGCSNILACLKLHVDYGLSSSPDWESNGFIDSRVISTLSGVELLGTSTLGIAFSRLLGTIYNLSYIVIINLVLPAIISGLIIDTFSTMRDEQEAIQEDIQSNCFICSISRDEFEKYGISFRRHVREEHNMWKYVWFNIYLDLKDPLDYSATENHAFESMKSDLGFIKLMPIKRSMSLMQFQAKENLQRSKDISSSGR